ncbi:3-dehydroquinate synthase [Pararobbsia silviterrae]|uniref:3-dehydroquinate synthase n=1 Tax=Pararobbsia silviterrae TaxID=1792498 RepID=A0A494Y8R3_9BURK|nr:3-dehydroquinate synthase [Pararobbsia silviterrae]
MRVGRGLLAGVVAAHADAIYLVDERLAHLLPASAAKRVLIEANETRKSLEAMPDVILKLRELGANRSTHIVSIGGGVLQDIATFAASVYMRGLKWTYMPTTLLGMADSCIGGKSSINVLGYKNLVGNFYPPVEVVIDIDFIRSLDAEQVIGGLNEAVKICYARGAQSFADYLADGPVWPLPPEIAQRLLTRSLTTKKWFIEIDEFDRKERLLLNYGHTFGHALEAATQFGVSHGVAVGLGMLVAIDFAKRGAHLTPAGTAQADALARHVEAMTDIVVESGVRWPRVDLAAVLQKFDNDKKHNSEFYRVVVPVRDGELELISIPRTDATRAALRTSYEAIFAQLGIDSAAQSSAA